MVLLRGAKGSCLQAGLAHFELAAARGSRGVTVLICRHHGGPGRHIVLVRGSGVRFGYQLVYQAYPSRGQAMR